MKLTPDDAMASGEGSQISRRLPENSMEYMIFVMDENLDGIKLLHRLKAISNEATRLMERTANRYIWQRDEFHLEVANVAGLLHLHGRTDYGDAVEDEWLIVYVLRELSKAHAELFIRVADEDGEFLLVEGANVLPNWLNPEIDHCRVWIHDGHLKIIPLSDDKTSAKPLTLPEAVEFLKLTPESLIQSPLIENEAFYRLEKYPQHAEASIHHSIITIPRRLAYILHELPKTISAAVEAFYLRDNAAMRKIKSSNEILYLEPTDLVDVSVKFSRVLFAQLRSQRFDTPPKWQDIVQSYTKKSGGGKEPNTSLTALEDGMKLTCGYEMLALTAEKSKTRSVREFSIMLEDLKEDGDQGLPADVEIEKWEDAGRNDDESWLDINFEDFERELGGKHSKPDGSRGQGSGFGDASAQENLRKIVSRFESFLNNESAGLDGADIDEMDRDNDEDSARGSDDSDENSDFEDKEVSFDEETFSRMMREMMGLPADDPVPATEGQAKGKAPAKDGSGEDDEIRNLSLQMEAELRGHGALCLDDVKGDQCKLDDTQPLYSENKAAHKQVSRGTQGEAISEADEKGADEEISIDYNLAKNLLESFKSQGGMAGPTGNLLGLMGLYLPRDEDDGNEEIN